MSKELLLAGTTLLDRMTRDLDINETQYDRAVKAYTTVGEWLCAEGSCVRPYSPNIYPQGSMRLGTVVKPRPEKEEFDVDLACELEHPQGITRETLREIVGKRIKESDRYKDNIEPRHRCWRLNYSDSAQFHLDIVPAIPDNNLRAAPPTNATGPGSILITDDRIPDWLHSNPKGYAEWFESRMQTLLEDIRKSLKYASVQDIPYHKRKTPLQKAIQVLKRHRDNMFGNNDHRPTSIIITTLAAHAYGGESDLYAALNNIMNDFEDAIKSKNGRKFIPVYNTHITIPTN